jgi:RimJ/RimL family protein N-acetyltransferase
MGGKKSKPVALLHTRARLLDGSPVILRALSRADRANLISGFEELSPHSTYMRFLGYKANLSESELDHLTHQDPAEHLSIGIEFAGRGEHKGIGVARYQRDEGSEPITAEFGVVVADRYHGLGGATLLLKQLCQEARRNGICCLRGEVLETNLPMLKVLENFNPRFEPGSDEDTLVAFIPLQGERE